MATEMALSLLKRPGLLVILSPAVYVGLCACGTIGGAAYRFVYSEFSDDPVIKEEMSKLYDRARAKKNSSESLFELLGKEERAALIRDFGGGEWYLRIRKRKAEMEATLALDIWKQNCWRSMIADFQRRLYSPLNLKKKSPLNVKNSRAIDRVE